MKCSKASDWLKELMSEIPELLSDIEDYSKALNEKEARFVGKYQIVALFMPTQKCAISVV